jgi:hypothetical protein
VPDLYKSGKGSDNEGGDVVNWLMSAQEAMIENIERYSLAEIKEKE